MTHASVLLCLVSLLLGMALTAQAFLVPSPPPQANPLMLSRRSRPTTPSAAPTTLQAKKKSGAAAGPTTVGGGSLRGFTKVLDVGSELAEAEGSQKAVGPLGKDNKTFLLLIRRKGGKISSIDANCGRCKFPLLKGKVSEDLSLADEDTGGKDDKGIITCPLCAVRFSLGSGLVTGAQADGVLQRVSASFFSKQIATGLKTYEAEAATDGGVYVRLR